MTTRLDNAPHVVYRCYDDTGRLLYVGCTSNWPARLRVHRHDTEWWTEEAWRTTFEQYADRAEAYKAERQAIRDESPLYNIMHNSQRGAA